VTRAARLRGVRLLPLALFCCACGVSENEETAIGRKSAERIDSSVRLVRDPVINEYVQQLGLSIARTTSRADLDWRFLVVDSREVNAFALPGGLIYVNRGLIERAERLDELAGALAHEIGHVVRRHSVQQMKKARGANVAVSLTCTLTRICDNTLTQAAIQVGGAALFASYSRQDEAEADSEAVENVIRAGIDPEGIPTLFLRLIDARASAPLAIETFFATHPLEARRIESTNRLIDSVDPERLRGLVRDDPSYQELRARLDALPAPPAAPARPR
ncbi:MAG TPA: M48 family metallopeptidase, partial [Gemmatimonadaceae bacterium]|nr:M48 family metallopeptidase [Gemmatimonadaceae bacterium]